MAVSKEVAEASRYWDGHCAVCGRAINVETESPLFSRSLGFFHEEHLPEVMADEPASSSDSSGSP